MQPERETELARRWGLVTPVCVALCVVLFLRTCLDELFELRLRVDPRTLADRMSQLKPFDWKAPALLRYGELTFALVFGAALVMIVLGVRDALRGEPED